MSQETVEVAYRAYAAFNRRDLDAVLALTDPDVEVVPRLAGLEGSYRGHSGVRRWWQNLLDAWPDYKVEVLELRDLGEVTLAKVNVGGHAADSGIPVSQTSWHVCRWRHRRIVWLGVFTIEAEALEAAGPRE
jgi:ketosteroid isomerase-like protein